MLLRTLWGLYISKPLSRLLKLFIGFHLFPLFDTIRKEIVVKCSSFKFIPSYKTLFSMKSIYYLPHCPTLLHEISKGEFLSFEQFITSKYFSVCIIHALTRSREDSSLRKGRSNFLNYLKVGHVEDDDWL